MAKMVRAKMQIYKFQTGFAMIEGIIAGVVVGLLIIISFSVIHTHQPTLQPSANTVVPDVVWKFQDTRKGYKVIKGRATKCPKPLKFDYSPADTTNATGILPPGQYRGYDYKSHGGIRFDNNANGAMEIRLPMDATLTGMTGYLEGDANEIQYIVNFESDCGIAFKFDHLNVLTRDFQSIAATRPAPQKDDTGSDPNNPPPRTFFKAGTVIATAIGYPTIHSFGFDFGVYDYRSANEISKNNVWRQLHTEHPATDWYGRCWFDMLPEPDASRVKALSMVPINSNKPLLISDYCTNYPHTTLEFNGGLPTDSV
jgi:hypothetical protein